MTLLDAPAPDLEALAGLDLSPEYVLAFIPPWAYARIRDRIAQPGFWELLTVADFESGNPAPDGWSLDAPRDTPVGVLAAWVRGVLGYPVALEADTVCRQADARLARWHAEPLFWVRRDT